jgi:outer membrane protein assembly factor BamB
MFRDLQSPLAVMPVLVGPLQVLLALLPAMLLAFGGALLALFKPSGLRKLGRFLWHQKVFSVCLLLLGLAVWQGYPRKIWSGMRNALGLRAAPVTESASAGEWPTSRGGPHRTGYAGGEEPTSAGNQWAWNDHKTVFSSPTVAGDRVYFTTVTGIGPFTPTGKGAVVCVDSASGRELWRYEGDDGDLRGTFSSPAIGEGRLVVGEGLHQTSDARVTCLDLSGRKVWDFRTSSHVESTPCIHAGRVYVAAAGDGFYCFDLKPDAGGKAQVLWHLTGDRYLDCESSAVSDGKTVWFGLGEEGNAIVAVNAMDGTERWRVATPYPVFAAPTLVQDEAGQGRIYIGMGNGNFVFSADELRAAKVESMRDEGKSAEEIAAVEKKLATAGAVWSIDAASGEVEWKYALPDTVLDSIAYQPSAKAGDPGRLYFGSRDGHAYALSADGKPLGKWNAGSPILASPALARQHVYFATKSGRLFALKTDTLQPVWDMTVQQSGTLTSSPAVADGRVFIGTEDQGLRCVGTCEPPLPPIWNRLYGDGGAVDDSPLPDEAEIEWTFIPSTLGNPDPKSEDIPIDRLVLHDGSLIAVAKGTLMRVSLPESTGRPPRLEWHRRVSSSVTTAVQAVGDRLLIHSIDEFGRRITVEAIRAFDGESLWQRDFTRRQSPAWWTESEIEDGSHSRIQMSITVDAERLYLWTETASITCLDLENGQTVWSDAELAGGDAIATPVLVGDILFLCGGQRLVACDSRSGKPLWSTDLESNAHQEPLAIGSSLVTTVSGGLRAVDVRDGRFLWHLDHNLLPGLDHVIAWPGHSEVFVAVAHDGAQVQRLSDGKDPYETSRQRGLDALWPYHPTGLFRGDQILVRTLGQLLWWTPAELQTQVFFELKSTGKLRTVPVAGRGKVYFASENKGIVCLRGVTP